MTRWGSHDPIADAIASHRAEDLRNVLRAGRYLRMEKRVDSRIAANLDQAPKPVMPVLGSHYRRKLANQISPAGKGWALIPGTATYCKVERVK